MPKYTYAAPIPPVELGCSWTGKTLLNWILDQAKTPEEKQAFFYMKEGLGPEKFRAMFEAKALELNRRGVFSVLDPRDAPQDEKVLPLIVAPGGIH